MSIQARQAGHAVPHFVPGRRPCLPGRPKKHGQSSSLGRARAVAPWGSAAGASQRSCRGHVRERLQFHVAAASGRVVGRSCRRGLVGERRRPPRQSEASSCDRACATSGRPGAPLPPGRLLPLRLPPPRGEIHRPANGSIHVQRRKKKETMTSGWDH
jgi:hypothetical protein